MATLNWNALPDKVANVTHEVFVRGSWGDTWVKENRLHCQSATWCIAPLISSATLIWQHGRVREPQSANPVSISKVDRRGWFVKIVFATHDQSTKEWIGFVDSIVDNDYAATLAGLITGKQKLVCYGIEQALLWTEVKTTWDDNGTERVSQEAPIFNENGKPNQSSGVSFFAFNEHRPDKVTPAVPAYWSTRSIVRYLIEKNAPKNHVGAEVVNFSLKNVNVLPDWDKPQLDTNGRTVFECLNQIISADRMLFWRAKTTDTKVEIEIGTRTEIDVTLADGVISANPDSIDLIADSDPLTVLSPASSTIESTDQVVCRGAKRISVISPQWVKVGTSDQDLLPAWDDSLNQRWHDGAKNDTNYATLNKAEQIERNAARRADSELERVGNTFVVVPRAKYFPPNEDDSDYNPRPGSLTVLDWLPLREGVDYATIPDDADHERKPYRKPSILRKEQHFNGDYSSSGNGKFSARSVALTIVRNNVDMVNIGLDVTDNGKTIQFHSPIPFEPPGTPLPGDESPESISPVNDIYLQIGIEEDRYSEGRYPEDQDLPTRDILKRTVVEVGKEYKQIYMAQDVLLRVDETGTQVFAQEGYIRDDSSKLESLAKAIYTWRSRDRRECNVATQRFLSQIDVGNVINRAKSGTDAVEIGSVIDSITLTVPEAGPATVDITTNLQEANWIGLLG